jgi:DNA ligase (NAD+)
MSDIQSQIEQLRDEIRRHDYLYYVMARPEISDRDYDQMLKRLAELEQAHPEFASPDSPTQRVGGEPIEGFETVEHSSPMLSIDNTYNEADLGRFDQRVRDALGDARFHYLVDPKIDGVAVSLRYEGGRLALAATRGDGRRGDDITNNARRIRAIPLRLLGDGWPDVLEVRGEIYWPTGAFTAYNSRRAQAGQPTFANPRNGTAGTLKQLDPTVVAERGLSFIAHGFGEISQPVAPTASELMHRIAKWGVPVNNQAQVCDNIGRVIAAVENWITARTEVDYATDGMVVKVDELALRDELGATSKYPRWCIAYKYEAERAETVLRSISFQVGRTGVLTPAASFDPVWLSGTTVVNASLHNFDQVARLDVREGDTVLVEKAGEIIPQVVQVNFEKRPPETQPVQPPDSCPACGGKTGRDPGGVYLRCLNPECPAQLRERLIFFAGRDQMDIDGLGPAIIDQLLERGMVRHFADLYHLRAEELTTLERMGAKSSENLAKSIDESRSRGLARVLAALGVRHVGSRAAEVLAEHFGDVEAIESASVGQLTAVHEIGPIIAESVRQFFDSEAGRETVRRLRDAGVKMTVERHAGAGEGPLTGKTVVVTGTLEGLSRKEAEDAIKAAGGKMTSSVSRNTSFVVVGAEPGSKAAKAVQLGVETIDEDEFLRRLHK